LNGIFEHAGFERAHDPHHWWVYDARETSPKTCPLCLSLHGTDYRGDEIDMAFPYHIHIRVNAIKANAHAPRDYHCRCLLHWAGRTKDVLDFRWGTRKPRIPDIPKKVAGRPVEDVLTPDLRRMRKKIVKYARETWKWKRNRL